MASLTFLDKGRHTLLSFLIASTMAITGCSSEEPTTAEEPEPGVNLKSDSPFAYIERGIESDALADQMRFQKLLTDPQASPLKLRVPYDFNPGAKLFIRSGLDANATTADVIGNFFGSDAYDVKDLRVSDDGATLIFAAHGPENHPTDNTWNIYRYNIEQKVMERVIADNIIANSGHDTHPVINGDTIFFSSTRDQRAEDELALEDGCYIEEPPENPSLIHKMNVDGSEITQLTFGRYNHDFMPVNLTDGRVAFVRWTTEYVDAPTCATAKRAKLTEADPFLTGEDRETGLNQTPPWSIEKTCALSQVIDGNRVVAQNRWGIYLLDANGENFNQLYNEVVTSGDEAFLHPTNLVQDESGKLSLVLKHQYNPQLGGALLQLDSNLSPTANTIFSNFAPNAVTEDLIDLYPGQRSLAGWYGGFAPYYDNSGRYLIGWSQCSITGDNGVTSFCSQNVEGDISTAYGLWALAPVTSTNPEQSQLPVIRARSNAHYVNVVISQERVGSALPYQALNNGVVDFEDAAQVICEAENNKPVANAGIDQVGPLGTTFRLNGAGSSDADGDSLTYSWTIKSQPEGSNLVIVDSASVSPQLTPAVLGNYEIQLVVSDGKDTSAADTVNVTVTEVPNAKPVAEAGLDQAGVLGTTFQLNGSGSSDADGDALNYSWAVVSRPEGSMAAIVNATTPMPTFTPDMVGSYQVQLVVDDSQLSSDPDYMMVTVSRVNPPDPDNNQKPVANAGLDQSAVINTLVMLDGSGSSDPDNNALTYAWTLANVPAGNTAALVNPTSPTPQITPDALGVYEIQLVVNDGTVNSDPDTVLITVSDVPNNRPVANAGPDQSGMLMTVFNLDGTGSSDVDQDPLTYRWSVVSKPDNSAVSAVANAGAPTTSITPDVVGTYVIQLIVNDGKADSTPDAMTITVVPDENMAPTANAGPDQSGDLGATFTLNGSGSFDPNGDSLSYRWTFVSVADGSELDDAYIADATRVNPSFTPDKPGDYVVQLVVSDGLLTSAPDTVRVSVTMVGNNRPVANAGPDQVGPQGKTFTLDGTGSVDLDGDTLRYTWMVVSQPQGSAINFSGQREAVAQISPTSLGVYVIQLIVGDGKQNSEPDEVVITVQNRVNGAPIADAGPDQKGLLGSTFTLDGSASKDPEDDELTYTWLLKSKPEGSELALVTLESLVTVPFTPDVAGDYIIELFVNDSIQSSSADEVKITAELTPNLRPTANAGPDQTVSLNQVISLDGSGSSDPEGDILTYQWRVLTPAGAIIENGNTVMPMLTIDQEATYEVQLVVNDGNADSDPDIVVITVEANTKPVANAGPDVEANIGDTVQLSGAGSTDADGDTLSYMWTVVEKPEGSNVMLSDGSVVNPQLQNLDTTGTYLIQLIVSDGMADSDPDLVKVTIGNRIPVANAGPDQCIKVNTPITLDGSGSTDADGDALTYRWRIVSPANTTATLVNVNTVSPTFTTTDLNKHVIELIVNDGKADSLPDTVELCADNARPVANAGPDQTARANDEVKLDGSGSSDADGDPLTYLWTITKRPAGSQAALSDETAIQPTFTVDVLGDYEVQLVVSDGLQSSAPDTVKINAANSAPIANAGPDQIATVGTEVKLDGMGSRDPDGDDITYRWNFTSKPDGSTVELTGANSPEPRFTPDERGTYVIQLIVNDGMLDSSPDTVVVSTENTRPIANIRAITLAQTKKLIPLDGTGSFDPDGDVITYMWSITKKPESSNASIADTTVEATSITPDVDGEYVIQLIVNDGELSSQPATVSFKASSPPPECDLSDETQRTIPVTIRDFKANHPDFQYRVGVDLGIVKHTLGHDKKPVYAKSYGSTPTTTGRHNFNQWYRNCPSINYEIPHTLTMTREMGSTIWDYDNNKFFPIDDRGFGNSGMTSIDRNYHFTLETHLEFDYKGGEVFTFRGDDDLWLFINGKLAIDIGGVHSAIQKTIRLDEIADDLGITVGNRYSFDLFFAERHTVASSFKFQTNMDLECIPRTHNPKFLQSK